MAQAEIGVILALYVGESFIEAHLSHNQKPLHFSRWYLGKEGFKVGLQKFFQEAQQKAGVEKVSRAIVASRFVEKILAYRLGGSVATLTTKGFEAWPSLRQPTQQKFGPLSSADLIFPVDERCNADGIIEKPVSDEEIASIVEQLRQKQAKRVCIHFLNASKNPSHQNKVRDVLLRENFDVFVPTFGENSLDEVAEWRKNILNASLSGTFEEVQDELNEGLKPYLPDEQRAEFLSAEDVLFDRENQHRLSSLWGAFGAWARALKKQHHGAFEILYLGLEQFNFIQPDKKLAIWNSPWGAIHAPQVQNQNLSLQPTTPIEMNAWGELSFAKNALGFEPGPMFMGRGQIPTLLDLWADSTADLQGVGERRSPQGLQKFKNQLLALNKSSAQKYDSEAKLLNTLQQTALQKLSLEISMLAEGPKILCLGALAPLFVPELKKRLPHLNLELLPENETSFLLSQGHEHVV